MTYDDGKPLHPKWVTVDFAPQRAGRAEMIVDDAPQHALDIVGWLRQEERWYGDDQILRATGRSRVVPGYLGPAGAVVPLEAIAFALTGEGADDVKAIRFAVQLNADGDQMPPTVHVTVEPAPVTVEVIEPTTRRVVRNQQGDITMVVSE